ncbi:hypothetical protein DM01DRAFT_1338272 [Hesseltinella vesiculosa]|uniref:C3H1-type domain-containing protein n=1 Tax=Hesseltinella vesiculosa TaxID=101127 RepID=A0A1X2GAC0_9FUNG|nr:hypothetical protein DM01DRAFT_1338272 [Hesseltinella vesiculosa]
MDDQLWDQLKNDIQEKCVAYEYIDQNDDTLSLFIINLIKFGTSAQDVSNELASMIGDDYDQNLTSWIFGRMDELQQPAAPVTNMTTHAVPDQVEPAQQPSQSELPQQYQSSQPEPVRRSAPDRRNRMFAQALGSMGQGLSRAPYSPRRPSRSRSRSPHRDRGESHHSHHHHRHSHSPSRPQRESFDESPGRPSVFSRLADTQPNSDSVFDRLGIQKPEAPVQPVATQRCKYWPTCSHGDDCTYIHPSSLCPDFPNCPNKTEECLYIHPAIRPNHRASQPTTSNPNVTERATPCRYFPNCNNDLCPFFHPPVTPSFENEMPTNPGPKRLPIPCNYGDKCLRPGCHFLHPKDNDNPAEVVCKFDGACSRPNCFFKHVVQKKGLPTTFKRTLVLNQQAPPKKTDRQFAVADDSQVEKIIVGKSADLIQN